MYNKVCKYCGKNFESEQRNKRYCSQECCDKAQIKNKKVQKHRAVKRKEYAQNKDINRLLSRAYALCYVVVDLYKIPKVCQCEKYGLSGKCTDEIQFHHLDGNPFNNSPWNIIPLCTSHHKMWHDKVGNINQVDTYNEAVEQAEDLSEELKSEAIIEYTRDKIKTGAMLSSEREELDEMISYLNKAEEQNKTVYFLSMGKYTKEKIIKRLIEVVEKMVR